MKPYYETKLGKLYHGDCLDILPQLDNESIDLIITSPPYFNLRDYSFWNTYEEHLVFIKNIYSYLDIKLKKGRHIGWNIQDNIPEPTDKGREYYCLMPDTIKIATSFDLVWERNLVWHKNNATQVMFGSYPYPPNMIYSCTTESICIFRKRGKTDLSNKTEQSKVNQKEWNIYKNNLWTFTAETKSEHTAPFPKELPERLIKMHSFENDLVLDCFLGSGTTAVVCEDLKRRWIGIEKEEKYCELASKRIDEFTKQGILF